MNEDVKFWLKSLNTYRYYFGKNFIETASDYEKYDVESFKRNLFGEGEWKFFENIFDSEGVAKFGAGIIFGEGRFAFLFAHFNSIYFVRSEEFFGSPKVVLDARLCCGSDDFEHLKFYLMNCDKIENGKMGLQDFFECMGMHQ